MVSTVSRTRSRVSSLGLLSVAAAGICGTFAATSHAALVAYEGFNYTATTQVVFSTSNPAVDGGTGWSTKSWEETTGNTPYIQAGSLTFGTLATAGNMLTIGYKSGYNGSGAYRTLSTSVANDYTYGGSATNTMWISELVQQNTAGDQVAMSLGNAQEINGAHYAPIDFGSFAGTVGGVSGNYYGFGTSNLTSTPVATGTTAFLVLEMAFNSTNNTVNLTLYVDPTPGLSAPSAGTSSTTDTFLSPFSASGALNLYGNGWSFDELRFGNTYADVALVPEPTTLALLAAAGAGILLLPLQRAGQGRNNGGGGPANHDEEWTK